MNTTTNPGKNLKIFFNGKLESNPSCVGNSFNKFLINVVNDLVLPNINKNTLGVEYTLRTLRLDTKTHFQNKREFSCP